MHICISCISIVHNTLWVPRAVSIFSVYKYLRKSDTYMHHTFFMSRFLLLNFYLPIQYFIFTICIGTFSLSSQIESFTALGLWNQSVAFPSASSLGLIRSLLQWTP